MWKDRIQKIRAQMIRAVSAYRGSLLTSVPTPDFGDCPAVDRDDSWLLLPKGAEPRIRDKRRTDDPSEDALLSSYDTDVLVDIADSLPTEPRRRYRIRTVTKGGHFSYGEKTYAGFSRASTAAGALRASGLYSKVEIHEIPHA